MIRVGGCPEPFLTERVSAAARKAWLIDHPAMADAFVKAGRGYAMTAWASQILFCRAYGRGVHSGRGKPPHPYDRSRGRWWLDGDSQR